MLYQFLIALFVLLCLVMILIILLQKGKSSMGLGGLGGGTQLLFGGSGGQDLFQKVTWGMGAAFMAGSLLLAMIKRPSASELLGSLARSQTAPIVLPKTIPSPVEQPSTHESASSATAQESAEQPAPQSSAPGPAAKA